LLVIVGLKMAVVNTMLRRAYGSYLREKWRRSGFATLRLAGDTFRFTEIDEPSYEYFAYEVHRGRWESRVLAAYSGAIQRGDTVLDIGAYVGPYALLGSARVGHEGRVFTFEPDPVARGHLEANLLLNGASNVQVVSEAVAAGPGWLRLTGQLGSSRTRASADHGGGLRVRSIGLDNFCSERSATPAVVKIDIEGGESALIDAGGERTLREARVVIMEIHPHLDVNAESIDRRFQQWGKLRTILDGDRSGPFHVAYWA
jgi:FkbM family methyltransferase